MSHTGDYSRQVSKPSRTDSADRSRGGTAEVAATSVAVAPAEPATRPLDWHGTRRATRYRVRPGVEIQLDGNPAQRRRPVDRRRAGRVVDDPAAESEGPHQHSERRLRDAVPRRDRLGQVRAAEAERAAALPRRRRVHRRRRRGDRRILPDRAQGLQRRLRRPPPSGGLHAEPLRQPSRRG